MNEFIDMFSSSDPSSIATSMKLLLLLTVLALAPSILIFITSFTRTVIVLSFVLSSLSTQQMPPNLVLIGISFFLTFFIMVPIFSDVYVFSLNTICDEEYTLYEAF